MMDILKCKTTVLLIIMIFGVTFIGSMDNASFEDNVQSYDHEISINA